MCHKYIQKITSYSITNKLIHIISARPRTAGRIQVGTYLPSILAVKHAIHNCERKTPSWSCASGTCHPLPRFTGIHIWHSQFQSLAHTKYSLCIFSVTHSVPGSILRFHNSKHSNHTISLSSTSISCPYLPPVWRYTQKRL